MRDNKLYINFLDEIRGIAIIAVFLFHSLGAAFGSDHLPWGDWFRDFSVSRSFIVLLPATCGWAGVAIFFVVSGFCIHLSFARGTTTSFVGFYIRRFFRIYPPYFIALVFFTLLFPTTRFVLSSLSAWGQFVSHLFIIHNLDRRTIFGINPSFWSIAVEVQLYLLYPLLLAMVAKLGWNKTLLCVGVIEISMRAFSGIYFTVNNIELPIWFTGSPFIYWFSWSIGAAAANAYLQNRPLPFARSSSGLWLLLAVIVYFIKPLLPFSFLFISISTCSLIGKLLYGTVRTYSIPSFFTEHLRLSGALSYSIYLIHQPILITLSRLPTRLNADIYFHPLLIFLLCLSSWPIIIQLSQIYYWGCEMPSINIGKRIIKKISA